LLHFRVLAIRQDHAQDLEFQIVPGLHGRLHVFRQLFAQHLPLRRTHFSRATGMIALPAMKRQLNRTLLEITSGDITERDEDAIVNTANAHLVLGSSEAEEIAATG